MPAGTIVNLDIRPPKPWLNRESRTGQRPLIEFCTNEWKNDQRDGQNLSFEETLPSTNISFEEWSNILTRRHRGRSVIALVFLSLCAWFLVSAGTSTPQHIVQVANNDTNTDAGIKSLNLSRQSEHTFGINKRPQLSGVSQLKKLDAFLLPSTPAQSTDQQDRRLIFIGDIHGCIEELTSLLSKAGYKEETDHIIVTGDIVNKGPSSQAVIDLLRERGASCVRGNHDDRILLKREQHTSHSDSNLFHDDLDDPEMILAMSLTREQLTYLQSCPIILEVGDVPPYGKTVVVHGGLIPSIALENQDPWTAMNMRIIHPASHIPSKEHSLEGYLPWSELWQHYQSLYLTGDSITELDSKILESHRGMTVIYGHDAGQGLRIRKHSKELDSACVKGRRLTALIVSSKPDEEIVQVDCQRYV